MPLHIAIIDEQSTHSVSQKSQPDPDRRAAMEQFASFVRRKILNGLKVESNCFA